MKKRKNTTEKPPADMTGAKAFCRRLCRKYGYSIDFDDKWHNFYPDWNRCACAKDRIECARFSDRDHDLLVFAVMHEIGHLQCDIDWVRKRNGFVREYDAWRFAIELYTNTFGRNISVKMAMFMLKGLGSYLPNYNDLSATKDGIHEREAAFWCPLKKRVLRK